MNGDSFAISMSANAAFPGDCMSKFKLLALWQLRNKKEDRIPGTRRQTSTSES
jgi:hypothetical protein